MKKNDFIKLYKESIDFFNNAKYHEVISLLKDDLLIKLRNEDLYIIRGNAWYCLTKYDLSIADYLKSIDIKQTYELAYYNLGAAYVALKDYKNAIINYEKVISLNSDYAAAYICLGTISRVNEDYLKSINYYTQAINLSPNDETISNAYYNRGLTYYKKALNSKDIELSSLKDSIDDFQKYLKLADDEDENGYKYAKQYIEELSEVIKEPSLWSIKQTVNRIRLLLQVKNESCVTHYTSLSVLKELLFDDSKFRISEGNYMNDPSEGKEFLKCFKASSIKSIFSSTNIESISTKPFIGSFVTNYQCKNLNMWRFYGKEKGEEAKGCAIIIQKQKFIDDIKNFLSDEKNKDARLDEEIDINFYRVAYIIKNKSTQFYIPNLNKSNELGLLVKNLVALVEKFKDHKSILSRYINSIAFLFKNEAYKNEEEVRLVVNGLEFVKKYFMGVSSPRVYIELVSIKNIVDKIILGPKVDKVNEWLTAFHYNYEKSDKSPKVSVSNLPYK